MSATTTTSYINAAILDAEKYGLNPISFIDLIQSESGFNPNAVNKQTGAEGIAQIEPATAKNPGYSLAPVNPFDPFAALKFAAQYLKARGGTTPQGIANYGNSVVGSSQNTAIANGTLGTSMAEGSLVGMTGYGPGSAPGTVNTKTGEGAITSTPAFLAHVLAIPILENVVLVIMGALMIFLAAQSMLGPQREIQLAAGAME